METMGQRLKRLRKELNVTLKEVAIDTGISLTLLCRYEKDWHKANLKNMAKLSNYYGVSIDYIYRGSSNG